MSVATRMGVWRLTIPTALLLMFSAAQAVAQVRRLGVYAPSTTVEAVRYTDASQPAAVFVLDENYRFATSASNAAFSWDRTYVIDGQFLREFKRNDLLTGPLRSYNAGAQLLDVEAGSRAGEVLLLSRTTLDVLDMNPSTPRVLASVPVTNNQPVWGDLLVLFGDTAYVAQNSPRGFKVIDLSDPQSPVVVAEYLSKAKVLGSPNKFHVTDLRRRDSILSLVVGGNLELVAPDNLGAPSTISLLGLARFGGSTRAVISRGYAFLADGVGVRIVNARPGTTSFLKEVLRFDTSATITDLFAADGKLYLLCGKLGYEIWDVSAYSHYVLTP